MTFATLAVVAILAALSLGYLAMRRRSATELQAIAEEGLAIRKQQIGDIVNSYLPVLALRYQFHRLQQDWCNHMSSESWTSDVNFFIDRLILRKLSDLDPLSRGNVINHITLAVDSFASMHPVDSTACLSREAFEASCAEAFISSKRKDIVEFTAAHLPTLARKFRIQACRKDDYGQPIWDGWAADVDYFIDKVMLRQLSGIAPCSRSEVSEYLTLSAASFSLQSSIEYDEGMSPQEYEAYCAELLRACGWSDVRTTPPTGDQGVDVIATSPIGQVWVFQCKKYSQNIGNSAVQEIIAGAQFYKANRGAVVANISYTESAKQLAAASGIVLLHHSELSTLH